MSGGKNDRSRSQSEYLLFGRAPSVIVKTAPLMERGPQWVDSVTLDNLIAITAQWLLPRRDRREISAGGRFFNVNSEEAGLSAEDQSCLV